MGGFVTPPVAGALFRAALVASCFLGAFPPVDLRAVCLVRAMASNWFKARETFNSNEFKCEDSIGELLAAIYIAAGGSCARERKTYGDQSEKRIPNCTCRGNLLRIPIR